MINAVGDYQYSEAKKNLTFTPQIRERHFGVFDSLRAEGYFNWGKKFFNERMKLCSKFLVKAMKVLEVSHH